MKTYKVFAPRSQQAAIAALGTPVMAYDAFIVMQLNAPGLRRISGHYPFEDMSAQYELPLHGGMVDPKKTRQARKAVLDDGKPHHCIVQFVGPVKAAWMSGLRRAGATVRYPTAGFGVIVHADGKALARIAGLPYVRWHGHLPHADRIARALTSAGPVTGQPRRRELPGSLLLEAFDGNDLPRLARAAEALGFAVVSRDKRARRLSLHFDGSVAQRRQRVAALATVHGVRLILPRVMPRTCNPVAARLVSQPFAVQPAPGLALSGQGEIVAVCDTGLDTGDAESVHPDFAGRVVAIRSYPISPAWRADVLNAGADDGASDTDSGHGTHVAGSVLGNGSASAAGPTRITGMAPKAQLVFQAVEQEVRWRAHVPRRIAAERFQLAGIPDDLEPLLDYAWRKGARIHSNSWGGGEPGEYDAQCGQLDQFVRRRKGMLVVVAAGNDGSDTGGVRGSGGDGRINPTSVASPATAKNCITVGASENRRPEFGGEVYGDWWPDDFPRAPFRNDPMADDPQQVVAFSSRGPTIDGRIKPELVAPGTFILSARSSQVGSNNFAWGAYGPAKRDYVHMGGTPAWPRRSSPAAPHSCASTCANTHASHSPAPRWSRRC